MFMRFVRLTEKPRGLYHQSRCRGFFPVIGGLLWMVDYRIPFMCGAAMSVISLIAVQQIRVSDERTAWEK